MSWIQTYTGKRFDYLHPAVGDIDPVDIGQHLSKVCRFNGACHGFYSVAEHAVLVSMYLEHYGAAPEVQWWGLHHDDAEAYVQDVSGPLKSLSWMQAYRDIENEIMQLVCKRFGMEWPGPILAIQNADRVLLACEQQVLLGAPPLPWDFVYETDDFCMGMIRGLDPEQAFELWTGRFGELAEQVNFTAYEGV